MSRNEKVFLYTIIGLILINIAFAIDFIPSGDINGKGIYAIKNMTNITSNDRVTSRSDQFCNLTTCKTLAQIGINTNTSSFIEWANESNLNVNSSNSTIWWNGINTFTGLWYNVLSYWENITDRPTHLSNFTNNLNLNNLSNSSVIKLAQENMYWQNITGRPTHLTNFTNDLNIGNWSDDQSDYYTLAQVNAIISSINNLTNNSIIIFVNDSIGNWSQDKNRYYNKTEIDSIVLSNSNLTLAQVVANIGNWSDDKNDYYNKTEVDGVVTGNRTAHETTFKHGNTSEEIQDVIGPWLNGTYNHATITYNDTTDDFNLSIHDDWWNDDTDIPYHEIIPQRINWNDVVCPTGYHYNNLLGTDLTCEQEQTGDPDLWIYLSGFNFIFNTSKLLEFLPTYYFTKTDINNATIIRNHNTSWVATSLSNTTIVRNGTKTCAGTTLLQNVTANSSGIFGDCVAPASAPAETDPYWSSNSSTVARTGTANCAAGTVAQNITTTTTGTTSQCVSIPSLVETDPLWTANQSSYLTRVDAVSYFVNRSLWTTIDNYPSGCSAGQYVTAIGDTLTCDTPSGSGDITSVNTSLDTYLYNGSDSGNVFLRLNDTKLTNTFTGYYMNRSLWTSIDNYPSACSAGSYVTAIGDTLSCDTPPGASYTADNNYLFLTANQFNFNDTKMNVTIDARSINSVQEDTNPKLGGNLNASGYNVSVNQGDRYCLNYACTSYVKNNGTHTLII